LFCFGARGSVVVETLCYKSEGRGFETRRCNWILSIYPTLPAALNPGVYSASNKIYYQRQIKHVSWRVEHGRCVKLTTSPLSVTRLYRQCGNLSISKPYRPSLSVTEIAVFYLCYGQYKATSAIRTKLTCTLRYQFDPPVIIFLVKMAPSLLSAIRRKYVTLFLFLHFIPCSRNPTFKKMHSK
jgi:hypothetical protein